MILELNSKNVKTGADLCAFIEQLVKAIRDEQIKYAGTLEEYLRSLWSLVQAHRDSQPSFSLMADLIARALYTEPAQFDEQWLAYTKPSLPEPPENKGTFEMLNDMLLYQIADLHRMKLTGQLDQSPFVLWLGIDSPTRHRWYNFDVDPYFECGCQCLDPTSAANDWGSFVVFLWCGQIYE